MGKKFTTVTLDPEYKTFIVYIASFNFNSLTNRDIYLSRRFQIIGLITKKTSIKIFVKYIKLANIFSPNLAFKIFKYNRINNHAIKLVDSQ